MNIKLKDLVRMPTGTVETYLLPNHLQESVFLRKLSTYAIRAKAKMAHRSAYVIYPDDQAVDRMVVVKVVRAGKKRGRPGRVPGRAAAKPKKVEAAVLKRGRPKGSKNRK